MNIVIVGFGSIGKIYYKILKKKKEVKKIFIIDAKDDPLKKIYSFKTFNKKKIYSKVHYAIICSPSHLHFMHAKYFLAKKILTLIEKPFVLKINHARQLIQLSRKNKTKCYTVYQNRYNKSIVQLKKMFSNKQKQKNIFLIDLKLFWKRDKNYYSDGWHGKYKYDGGVLVNQSIHMLDVLVYIFGEIKKFSVNAGFNKKKLEAEDLILLQFQLKNGILVNFTATTRSNFNYQVSIDILANDSRTTIEGISMNKFFKYEQGKKKNIKKYSENFLYGHGIHHKDVIECFITNNLDHCLIDKNTHVLKVIHSIYIAIAKKIKYFSIKNNQSILGK